MTSSFSGRRPGGRRDSDPSVLPLINVVFLLLIFFMLVGTLAAADPFEIAPPISASEGPSGSRDMIVLVSADGRMALDGAEMSDAELGQEIADRLADDPLIRLQLKADGTANATLVVEVLELLRDAGVDRLQLLTLPEAQ